MIGLTRRQADAHAALSANPDLSIRELAAAIGASQHNDAQRLVRALIERGYVRKLAHRDRSIEVLTPPRGDRLDTPFQPSRFGTDPSAGRPTAYTGPYPIRSGRTCADLIAEGTL